MSTNITAAHRRDFQAFTSGKYGNFAHFPFFIYGSPEAANVAVNQRPSTEERGEPDLIVRTLVVSVPRPRRHQGMSRDVSFRHRPDIAVPVECRAMIRDGALVAVNHSGGKDSQAMTISALGSRSPRSAPGRPCAPGGGRVARHRRAHRGRHPRGRAFHARTRHAR